MKKEKTPQFKQTSTDYEFYMNHFSENPTLYGSKIVEMIKNDLITVDINDGKLTYIRKGKTLFKLKCIRCWFEGNGKGWILPGEAHFMKNNKNIHCSCATEQELKDPYIAVCMKNETEVKPEEKTDWKLEEEDNNDGRL